MLGVMHSFRTVSDQRRSVFAAKCDHAVQYSNEGTTVSVELAREQTRTKITVIDTGPGISDSEISRMFQPFFRGAEGQLRRSEGHGLGLAIASRAIELHGGTIGARNTGSGLAVAVELPLGGMSCSKCCHLPYFQL
jgi:two-component system OmpR family sensor kinase